MSKEIKSKEDKAQYNKGFWGGVALCLAILFFVWIFFLNNSSKIDDYSYCVEECASENELCVSDYSLSPDGYYACINKYNSCVSPNYYSSCTNNFNTCVENYFSDLELDAEICSSDLTSCVSDCEE